jgi:acetyl esterase/lipase
MKIKFNQIDKELRYSGRLVRLINPTFTEARLRLFAKLKYRPKYKDKSIDFIENYITRADGSNLRLCIYKPKDQTGRIPGVLWLHGGGYAIGTPEQSMNKAKSLINASQCVVIAPDYRLSTEAPYPAALEDSYTTLLWIRDNASALGIREDQLMVGGESAGGGLTAALTLYARDKGEVAIAFQMPLYPMLDDRMASESAVDNNAPVWNSKSNANAWKLYLGCLFGTAKVPTYAAPARAEDYSHLPPTATFVGDSEPFRDETIEYVENLRKAGVPVKFKLFEGCYHAFETICPNAEVSEKAISFFLSAYKHAVDHYFAEQKGK